MNDDVAIATDPAPQASPLTERVRLVTELGAVAIEVYLDRAPISAAAFLRCVEGGAYAGASFFRTVRADNDRGAPPIEVVQAAVADMSKAHPGVPHETTMKTGIRHVDGTVSLARTAVGTGTSATFFICIGDQPALDFGTTRNEDGQGFAAFGRVVEGMEIVRAIHGAPTQPDAPVAYLEGQLIRDPVMILSAQRVGSN